MKQYKDELEIELGYDTCSTSYRYYFWRVQPYQLCWWDRLFNNQWHQLEHACDDKWNPCFSPADYYDYLAKLKTIEDIKKYKEEQWNKIQIERDKYVKHKIKFPYE